MPEPSLEERQAQRRKDLRDGCQFVLGCGGIIAIVAIVYWVIGFLPKSHPMRGADVVVFIDYKIVQNEIFWFGLFGSVMFFAALGTTKTTKGLVVTCAIFSGIALLVFWSMYSPVTAITFGRESVELHYLWPRSSLRIDARDIVSVDYDEGTRLENDMGIAEYTLQLRTRMTRYHSFGDTLLDDMLRTQQRIEKMQGR
jgi:hypothetical protein